MIMKREFNQNGVDLQEIMEKKLVEFYYELCELHFIWV